MYLTSAAGSRQQIKWAAQKATKGQPSYDENEAPHKAKGFDATT